MSSSSSFERDLLSGTISLVVLALLVLLLFVSIPIAIIGGTLFLIYFCYRLYQNSDLVLERKAQAHTHELYQQALQGLPALPDRDEFARQVVAALPDDLPDPVVIALIEACFELFDMEQFTDPIPTPPPVCNSLEGARYRDFLSEQSAKVHDPAVADIAIATIAEAFANFLRFVPARQNDGESFATVPVSCFISHTGEAVESLVLPFYADRPGQMGLFRRLRANLDRNVEEASGASGRSQRAPQRAVLPSEYAGDDVVLAYLKSTPLLSVFDAQIPLSVQQTLRHEHHWIVAGSGGGKSMTMKYLIAQDLGAVERDEASVVVLDSQGSLIDQVSRLKLFAPGEPLYGKLIYLNVEDVEWPLCLNLFDANVDRVSQHSMFERERLLNSVVDLYTFVIRSLLASEMTARQTTLFQFMIRLLLSVPDATIHTFKDLLQPDAYDTFRPYIETLDNTARQFFETDFREGRYDDTKKQLLSRLWGILRNPVFDRMFSHPKSKIDFFSEMQGSKVILINTSQNLLKEGASLFGRFMIGLIAQAAEERATVTDPLSTFIYIDEAEIYFDEQLPLLLSQVRKRNVGLILAHQYVGQATKVSSLFDSLSANTSIRFGTQLSAQDARTLAPALETKPEFIRSQPKGTFAAFIRGVTPTAVPLSFPLGHMERMEKMTDEEHHAIRDEMREKYAAHYMLVSGDGGANDGAGAEERVDGEGFTMAESDDASSFEQSAPRTHDAAKSDGEQEPNDPDNPSTDPSEQW